MNKHLSLGYDVEDNFSRFLQALRKGESVEWKWLIAYFRSNVIPWIRKKDGRLPVNSIISESHFVEQVFTQSLIQFYELFQSGNFESFNHIRSLMFKIADIKLKEAYRQHKKDQFIYFAEDDTSLKSMAGKTAFFEIEQQQTEHIQALKAALAKLPDLDRQILLKFANGERFNQIAVDLGLSEANCRKRKQRAMERLKNILKKQSRH